MSEQEILSLERDFWKTMAGGEHRKSASLLAGRAVMVSGMGTMSFTPDEYVKMAESGRFKITDWSFSDESVIFPTADSAVCSYRVEQTVEQDGKSETTTNVDSSVWLRDGDGWKCILHTETPAHET